MLMAALAAAILRFFKRRLVPKLSELPQRQTG